MKAKLVRESLSAEPIVKPDIKPRTRPQKPSPIRRDKPSVIPKPKATLKDVVDRFIKLTKN